MRGGGANLLDESSLFHEGSFSLEYEEPDGVEKEEEEEEEGKEHKVYLALQFV